MHSTWTLLRGFLIPLIVGLLAASAVSPCEAFARASPQAVVVSLDPCKEKAPTPPPCSCAQLACQVLLEPPAAIGHPILREEDVTPSSPLPTAAGVSRRPDVPPPRTLL